MTATSQGKRTRKDGTKKAQSKSPGNGAQLQPLTETEVVGLVDTICQSGDDPEGKTGALLTLIHEIDQSHRIKFPERMECDEITDIVMRRGFGRTEASREAEGALVANLRSGAQVQIR